MGGRSKGSDYRLRVFTDEGPVQLVEANDMDFQPNVESGRIQRTGKTESEPEADHNGWQVQATFDRESWLADQLIDRQIEAYHAGEPHPAMEILQTVAVPKLQGATKTYRYKKVVITSWQDSVSGQNDAAEISVTFETGRREEV